MKRKIAAIFAADAVGYSRLVAANEEDTLNRLAAARKLIDGLIVKWKGRIFNTAGDSVLAEFPSAVEAVRGAIEIQKELKAWNGANGADCRMDFRIGITIGDVVEDGDDLLGDAVNIASRLQSLSEPGSICISRSVQEAVNNKVGARMNDLGLKQLKNIPEPVRVYAVDPEQQVSGHSPIRQAVPRSRIIVPTAIAACILIAGTGLYGQLGFDDTPEEKVGEAPAVMTAAPEPEAAASPPSGPPTATELADPAPIDSQSKTAPPAQSTRSERTGALDPLAVQKILPRALRDCLNGELRNVRLDCELVVQNRIVTGKDLAAVEARYGQALRLNRQQDEAILAYNRSIEAHPTASAYNQRGIAFYDKKEWDRAIADYTEAVRLEPGNAEAMNNRAWTKHLAGRNEDALQDADAALRTTQKRAYIWDTRGHINEALGRTDAASADYRKALSLDPDMKSSKEGLSRLGAN